MSNTGPRVEPLADDAWLVTPGADDDGAANDRIHALAARIRDLDPAWLVDLVPAYAEVAVFFDARHIGAREVRDWLAARLDEPGVTGRSSGRLVEVPVAYGGAFGPDLEAAAVALGIPPGELVERHTGAEYTVAMIGFAPGFPYLSGLDPALVLPRHATPRTRVAAGSVGIGGAQTGIYPREGPGGWQLLGRTPRMLFDPDREAPALLQPGDRVRFQVIDAATFKCLEAGE